MANQFWIYHIYQSGKQWIGTADDKAEAMRLYRNGMNNVKVVRVAVDLYDTTTDPFQPQWGVVIDTDKTRIGVTP